MIARVCSEFVISTRMEDFLAKLRDEVLPAYISANGILSVMILRRALIGYTEVLILSLWESQDAVLQFASRESFDEAYIRELGIIRKERLAFDVICSWSSELTSRDLLS